MEAVAAVKVCFAESAFDIRRLLDCYNYLHRIENKSAGSETHPYLSNESFCH
jgi:hypothetical protein